MPHPIQTLKELFKLDAAQIESVERMFVERNFSKGDIFDGQHSMQAYVFYLKRGAARVFYTANGREHTVQFAFDDEYLDTRSATTEVTIMFMEDSEVIYMPVSEMHDFFSERESIHRQDAILFMNVALIHRIKNLEERIFYTQHASAVERYRWVINRYPRLLECATITQVASFLGLTKETLYRIRSGRYK
ncbi:MULTISPECIES: Crp/Fnr family transcriptional regulator [Muribaculum]|jgi:CRP-like cAMP-binding protein|uniref:Crp/Fnr family transcriptional regulator n=1 Tax=Muribaculum caecicola TaxID=3038144 RepID=A0AC61S6D7_9BACT|nr:MULTISPECIES: Crp/Fnr family transcriptional regulator [Muribaculum]THG54195.1 Crp/Fnr family transcriptional regulator [Muribaculum caecicola]